MLLKLLELAEDMKKVFGAVGVPEEYVNAHRVRAPLNQ